MNFFGKINRGVSLRNFFTKKIQKQINNEEVKDSTLFPNQITQNQAIGNNHSTDTIQYFNHQTAEKKSEPENNSDQVPNNTLQGNHNTGENKDSLDDPQYDKKQNDAITKFQAACRGYMTRRLENPDDKDLESYPMRRRIINDEGKIENTIVGYELKSGETYVFVGNPPSTNDNPTGRDKQLTNKGNGYVGLTSHSECSTEDLKQSNQVNTEINQILAKLKLQTIVPQHLVKTIRIEGDETRAFYISPDIGKRLSDIPYKNTDINLLAFEQLAYDLTKLHDQGKIYHSDLQNHNLFLSKTKDGKNIICTTDIGFHYKNPGFKFIDNSFLLKEIMKRVYQQSDYKKVDSTMKQNFIDTYIKQEHIEKVTNYLSNPSTLAPVLSECIGSHHDNQTQDLRGFPV